MYNLKPQIWSQCLSISHICASNPPICRFFSFGGTTCSTRFSKVSESRKAASSRHCALRHHREARKALRWQSRYTRSGSKHPEVPKPFLGGDCFASLAMTEYWVFQPAVGVPVLYLANLVPRFQSVSTPCAAARLKGARMINVYCGHLVFQMSRKARPTASQ